MSYKPEVSTNLADTYRKADMLLTEPKEVGDVGLTADQLDEKYQGDEHPVHTEITWRDCVLVRDTRRGYWDWVVAQIEEADHD